MKMSETYNSGSAPGASPDCREYIPRECSALFSRLDSRLARMEELSESIDSQLASSHQRLDKIASDLNDSCRQIARLSTELGYMRAGQRKNDKRMDFLLSAGWRVAVILASLAASITGLKNFFAN